jgi:uncharacterized phage-associated protein
MTVSAHDVAEALRRRLPAMGTKKLHKLLYYCQGHHLAIFGETLFGEPIAAWDMGPVVERIWIDQKYGHEPPARTDLGEAALNTVGYVVSRYGALTGRDLEVMTHGEAPWRLADATRRPGERVVIRPEWMMEYFRADGADDDDVDDLPLDSAAVSAWLRETAGSNTVDVDVSPDHRDDIRAWPGRGE